MSRGSCFAVPALEGLGGSRSRGFALAEVGAGRRGERPGGPGSGCGSLSLSQGAVSVAKQQPRAVALEFAVWPISRSANVNRTPAQVRPCVLSSRSDFLRRPCWDYSRSACRRRAWGQRDASRSAPWHASRASVLSVTSALDSAALSVLPRAARLLRQAWWRFVMCLAAGKPSLNVCFESCGARWWRRPGQAAGLAPGVRPVQAGSWRSAAGPGCLAR